MQLFHVDDLINGMVPLLMNGMVQLPINAMVQRMNNDATLVQPAIRHNNG